ncbi:DUF6651 domain-containing protein [Vreelandella sulfidaeris]|uniref:DUF6651 domain-containing protein n=1 Tax=Vreelandella sulfidaeris TaxID=115553 RepID=A0A455U6C7_9GAMM|nr:hypothetical protein HSBAA_29880 [Halomonas sulfidaeris]
MPWYLKLLADARIHQAAGNEGEGGGGGAATGGEGAGSNSGEGDKPAGGEGEKPAAGGEGEKPAEGDKPKEGGEKPTDREAELLKETMKRKERIKELETQLQAFGEVTPDQIKTLLEAENARKAEAAQREKDDLEKRGEWDRLKDMMATEHQTVLSAKDTEIAELREANAAMVKSLEDMTVGADFGNSKFISEELLLTSSKARVIYGSHFEVKDGKVVGYDKPAGAKERTMLVDGNGSPMSFDTALRKLVDADPERDSLIRSKAKPGTGSAKPEAGAPEKTVSPGVGRISAGLASFNLDSE